MNIIIKHMLLTSGVFVAPICLMMSGETVPKMWIYIVMYAEINLILFGLVKILKKD